MYILKLKNAAWSVSNVRLWTFDENFSVSWIEGFYRGNVSYTHMTERYCRERTKHPSTCTSETWAARYGPPPNTIVKPHMGRKFWKANTYIRMLNKCIFWRENEKNIICIEERKMWEMFLHTAVDELEEDELPRSLTKTTGESRNGGEQETPDHHFPAAARVNDKAPHEREYYHSWNERERKKMVNCVNVEHIRIHALVNRNFK